MAQWYCSIAGQRYGPAGDEELRAWAGEGRLRPADQVWTEGMPAWAPAGSVTGLFPAGTVTEAPTPTYYAPHRGGMILVLGIVGIMFACFLIPGICAWVMGNKDLRELDAGRMDPSGRGLVQAGRTLGIVGTILGSIQLMAFAAHIAIIIHFVVFGQ